MTALRFLTAGESHGQALTVILEGVPAGLSLTSQDIDRDLRRRQQGYGRSKRQQIEEDHAEILSGVRHGRTLGSPICLLIRNRVWEEWQEVMQVEPGGESKPLTRLRPGHADLVGVMKYGFHDVRNVLERASARETAARVAAGAVFRRLLAELGISVHSHVIAIGEVWAPKQDREPDWEMVEASPVRCADPETSSKMVRAIDAAKEAGETLGGIFEVWAKGVPIGLGSYVHWDRKLDGRLAQAIMSIHAVKGVEVGEGFALSHLMGSQAHDVILPPEKWGSQPWARATNRAGGLEGGVTNGQPIVIRGAVKPIATLPRPLPSVDLRTGSPVPAHYERSDICTVPAAGVIAEAMVCLVLAEAVLEKFGGDSMEELLRNYRSYLQDIGQRLPRPS